MFVRPGEIHSLVSFSHLLDENQLNSLRLLSESVVFVDFDGAIPSRPLLLPEKTRDDGDGDQDR